MDTNLDPIPNIESYKTGLTNKRGKKLLILALHHNLRKAETFFRERGKNKWTWELPDGQMGNEINNLFINNTKIVTNVRQYPFFNIIQITDL